MPENDVQLSYSKLIQITHRLAKGVLSEEWDMVFTGNSWMGVQLAIALELGYNPPDVFIIKDQLPDMSDKDYLAGCKYQEKFVYSWFDSYDVISQSCRNQVDKVMRLLMRLGYLTQDDRTYYTITKEALGLLQEPELTRIFISYRRSESSLLALYLQSRFKLAGAEAFIDVSHLKAGEIWEEKLKERIRNSSYFVSLLSKDSLSSVNVKNEIRWAVEANIPLIPVFHNGFRTTEEPNKSRIEGVDYLEKLVKQSHGYAIVFSDGQEHPNAYRNAADEILTSLGYAVL